MAILRKSFKIALFLLLSLTLVLPQTNLAFAANVEIGNGGFPSGGSGKDEHAEMKERLRWIQVDYKDSDGNNRYKKVTVEPCSHSKTTKDTVIPKTRRFAYLQHTGNSCYDWVGNGGKDETVNLMNGYQWGKGPGVIVLELMGLYANAGGLFYIQNTKETMQIVQKNSTKKGVLPCKESYLDNEELVKHNYDILSKYMAPNTGYKAVYQTGKSVNRSKISGLSSTLLSSKYIHTSDDYNTWSYPCYKAIKSNKSVLTLTWIDPEKEETEKSTTTDVTTLVKLDNPNNPSENFNNTINGEEWNYKNPITSKTYSGRTKPGEFDVTHKITATTWTIRKTHKWKVNASGNKISGSDTYTYTKISQNDMGRDIHYKANMESNAQVPFRPFNVNREGYANTGDNNLPSTFGNSTKLLQGSVSNTKGINDGSAMTTLDINNTNKFTINFGNNTFGLHGYDFITKPEALDNGSYEYTKAGYPYANGRAVSTDGAYRYDLQINESISTISNPIGASTASIKHDSINEEKPSDEAFVFDAPNTVSGGLEARFTLSGKYTLDNQINNPSFDSNLRKYWVASYRQTKFFEYGVQYNGVISLTAISAPNFYLPDGVTGSMPAFSTSGNNTEVSTNGSNQRGLYVGSSDNTYYQPIATATWDVKTLAGDTRK